MNLNQPVVRNRWHYTYIIHIGIDKLKTTLDVLQRYVTCVMECFFRGDNSLDQPTIQKWWMFNYSAFDGSKCAWCNWLFMACIPDVEVFKGVVIWGRLYIKTLETSQ